MAFDPARSVYVHGLQGASQGVKATLLRQLYPQMLIPDFPGPLEARQAQLETLLGELDNWTIVGSSLGGLMAAHWVCRRPAQARRLILLAPALIWPDFASNLPAPVDVPTLIYHGRRDEIVPLALARPIAEQVFRNLAFFDVDDDHGLYQTVHELNWPILLEGPITTDAL
jgi:pimeloyl-ACP methyl ester carboxylesterase